jgi:hypothetical protein
MNDAELSLDQGESIKIFVGRVCVMVWFEDANILSVSTSTSRDHDDFNVEIEPQTGNVHVVSVGPGKSIPGWQRRA